MKKLFILSMTVLLSACANTQAADETPVANEVVASERVVYREYEAPVFQEDNGAYRQYATQGRRVRVTRTPVQTYQTSRVVEDDYIPASSYSQPTRIMEDDYAPAPRNVYNRPRYARHYAEAASKPACNKRRIRATQNYSTSGNSSCPDQIRETREPVEVVYKKTTYRTVFEPKTYTDVSYEKEPYRAGVTEDVVVEEVPSTLVQTTTTTTTETVEK